MALCRRTPLAAPVLLAAVLCLPTAGDEPVRPVPPTAEGHEAEVVRYKAAAEAYETSVCQYAEDLARHGDDRSRYLDDLCAHSADLAKFDADGRSHLEAVARLERSIVDWKRAWAAYEKACEPPRSGVGASTQVWPDCFEERQLLEHARRNLGEVEERLKAAASALRDRETGLVAKTEGFRSKRQRLADDAEQLERRGARIDLEQKRLKDWAVAINRRASDVNGTRVAPPGESLADSPPRAEGPKDPASPDDYLTAEGHLKATLIVRDTGGFAGNGTGRRWVVEPSGVWLRVKLEDGKRVQSTGELSKEQLRNLAAALARYDLLHLPKEANTLTVADGINVLIEFGGRRSTFYGKAGFRDLPDPGTGTAPGRIAGVARAVEAALQEVSK